MSYLHHLKELATNSRRTAILTKYVVSLLTSVIIWIVSLFPEPSHSQVQKALNYMPQCWSHWLSSSISTISASLLHPEHNRPVTMGPLQLQTLLVSIHLLCRNYLQFLPVSLRPRFYFDEIFSDRHSLVTLWRQQPYCLFSISSPMLVFFIALTAI